MGFSDIIEKIKDIISHKIHGKAFDKHVAEELGISQTNLATMKFRNNIPYKEVCVWCAKNKICINYILFNQMATSLSDCRGR